METATIMMFVAGGAILLAIVLGIAKAMKGSKKKVPGVRPEGAAQGARKQQNKRGWRAPAGHYFNDADELIDEVGNLIIDMMIIAELCNEPYDGVVVSAAVPIEENLVPTIEEGPIESAPVVSAPEPVPSYSAPDPSPSDGGGGSDNADDD